MLPSFTPNNIAYISSANIKLCSQSYLTRAISVKCPYLKDLLSSEFASRTASALNETTGHSMHSISLNCAKDEMMGVYTLEVITHVLNQCSSRNSSIMEFPREPMSSDHSPRGCSESELTVTIPINGSCPLPALCVKNQLSV